MAQGDGLGIGPTSGQVGVRCGPLVLRSCRAGGVTELGFAGGAAPRSGAFALLHVGGGGRFVVGPVNSRRGHRCDLPAELDTLRITDSAVGGGLASETR